MTIQDINAIEQVKHSIHNENFSFESIDGGKIKLLDFKGSAILISNTASFCGFTNQYREFQVLYDKYGSKGFTIIAIPSDDFMQEYDNNEDVKDFCETNFGITFPVSEITKIIGKNAHPFYKWLNVNMGYKPRWNFNKILVSPEGKVVKFYGPTSKPSSEKFQKSIEDLLPRY